jgi:hypothetical protein
MVDSGELQVSCLFVNSFTLLRPTCVCTSMEIASVDRLNLSRRIGIVDGGSLVGKESASVLSRFFSRSDNSSFAGRSSGSRAAGDPSAVVLPLCLMSATVLSGLVTGVTVYLGADS